jgi:acyl-CoA oxidase
MERGGGQRELQELLGRLDFADSVGVLLVTELAHGNDISRMETVAEYLPDQRMFRLNTLGPGAWKFMPNVGLAEVPKIGVVVARLLAGGRDRGLFRFALQLRKPDGALRPGVRITALPDRPLYAMDNAAISFRDALVPRAGLLASGIAEVAEDGRFTSHLPASKRSAAVLEDVQFGRVGLSSGMVASARAALVITLRYARNRLTAVPGGPPTPMLAHRLVQEALITGLARSYAASLLANAAKRQVADDGAASCCTQLLTMAAKPFLTAIAMDVLRECRERCGAQGMFSVNRIADYFGVCQAVITAEGENQVMQLGAGRLLLIDQHYRASPCRPAEWPASIPGGQQHDLFTIRERLLFEQASRGISEAQQAGLTKFQQYDRNAPLLRELAEAYAGRLAADALLTAASSATPAARTVLYLMARLYSLDWLRRHGAWYLSEDIITPAGFQRAMSEIPSICQQLLPSLPDIIDSFGIADQLLSAPIAATDYVAAWQPYLAATD